MLFQSGPAHDRVDQARDPGLAGGDEPGRVFAHRLRRSDPCDRRERSLARRAVEVVERLDVASWWSCCTVSKRGSGFQMLGVDAPWGTCGQNIMLSAQSGWLPFAT